mmetsp:Transcript_49129/g.77675  ORF Transcript_49129/g.77675 Transcript_49129/m.77675 type:complete len:251 (-) Transcript_49129:319-1071(-)
MYFSNCADHSGQRDKPSGGTTKSLTGFETASPVPAMGKTSSCNDELRSRRPSSTRGVSENASPRSEHNLSCECWERRLIGELSAEAAWTAFEFPKLLQEISRNASLTVPYNSLPRAENPQRGTGRVMRGCRAEFCADPSVLRTRHREVPGALLLELPPDPLARDNNRNNESSMSSALPSKVPACNAIAIRPWSFSLCFSSSCVWRFRISNSNDNVSFLCLSTCSLQCNDRASTACRRARHRSERVEVSRG